MAKRKPVDIVVRNIGRHAVSDGHDMIPANGIKNVDIKVGKFLIEAGLCEECSSLDEATTEDEFEILVEHTDEAETQLQLDADIAADDLPELDELSDADANDSRQAPHDD